jgi:hypothetical protein
VKACTRFFGRRHSFVSPAFVVDPRRVGASYTNGQMKSSLSKARGGPRISIFKRLLVLRALFRWSHASRSLYLRSFQSKPPAGFQNRVETRVVVKRYGSPITEFTLPQEVLCALRDAIAGTRVLSSATTPEFHGSTGHLALVKKGTLHRDVSIQNVLVGKPGAEPGKIEAFRLTSTWPFITEQMVLTLRRPNSAFSIYLTSTLSSRACHRHSHVPVSNGTLQR